MYPRVIALFLFIFASGALQANDAAVEMPLRFDPASTFGEAVGLQAPQAFEIREQHVRVPTVDLTVEPDDLWERIRRGFAMPDLNTDLVTDRQIYYINRPAALRQIFTRGQRYLYHIVDELERRGMPTELALLPMVESAFNPMALSSAQASGLWQFIPSTGKSYNLEQNWWVDERRDVIASTNAALDYLQTIYEMHGDWHLALASYNWGEGAVGRAVSKNRAAGLPTEYQHLNMPGETRYYVPKLQALKNIVAQPELFGITLPHIPNRPYFVTVESRVALDLATAARLAETPVDEILALNPGYKRPVLPTNGSQSLVIPASKVEAFLINLSRHDPASASWRTYELRDGEGLESAADRLGISATRLRQVNGLSPRARIGSGYTLIVPSESEGDRITLANLLPTKPQAGAVEPPSPPHADPAHGGPGQEWPPDGGGTQGDGAGQCTPPVTRRRRPTRASPASGPSRNAKSLRPRATPRRPPRRRPAGPRRRTSRFARKRPKSRPRASGKAACPAGQSQGGAPQAALMSGRALVD
jgi:membrane-bound lytic murein transglycosylase D